MKRPRPRGLATADGRRRTPGIHLLLGALLFCSLPLAAQQANLAAPTVEDLQRRQTAWRRHRGEHAVSGCTGALGALAVSWLKFKTPDIGVTLNGVLAGLVAITSPCATVTPLASVIIGLLAGEEPSRAPLRAAGNPWGVSEPQ